MKNSILVRSEIPKWSNKSKYIHIYLLWEQCFTDFSIILCGMQLTKLYQKSFELEKVSEKYCSIWRYGKEEEEGTEGLVLLLVLLLLLLKSS